MPQELCAFNLLWRSSIDSVAGRLDTHLRARLWSGDLEVGASSFSEPSFGGVAQSVELQAAQFESLELAREYA